MDKPTYEQVAAVLKELYEAYQVADGDSPEVVYPRISKAEEAASKVLNRIYGR